MANDRDKKLGKLAPEVEAPTSTKKPKSVFSTHGNEAIAEHVKSQNATKAPETESNALQAAMEELPPEKAAPALNEQRTLNNVALLLTQLGSMPNKCPSLLDPHASPEKKASDILEVLALDLDNDTLQGMEEHAFTGLELEVVLQSTAKQAIKSRSPEVLAFTRFAEMLWQALVDQFKAIELQQNAQNEAEKKQGAQAGLNDVLLPVAQLLRTSVSTGAAT